MEFKKIKMFALLCFSSTMGLYLACSLYHAINKMRGSAVDANSYHFLAICCQCNALIKWIPIHHIETIFGVENKPRWDLYIFFFQDLNKGLQARFQVWVWLLLYDITHHLFIECKFLKFGMWIFDQPGSIHQSLWEASHRWCRSSEHWTCPKIGEKGLLVEHLSFKFARNSFKSQQISSCICKHQKPPPMEIL